MPARGPRLWVAERAIDGILVGTMIVIAIFDPRGIGKIAIPVIAVMLIIGWVAAWRRRRR